MSPATYASRHIGQAWRGAPTTSSGTQERPRAIHRVREKPRGIPGSLEEDLGPRRSTDLAHDAGPRLAGRRHLQSRTMRTARERPQSQGPQQRWSWPTAQDPIWRTDATCRSAAPLIRRRIHTQGGTPLSEATRKAINIIDM
jgi:hypothetical protein